jgi:hypothetical protein
MRARASRILVVLAWLALGCSFSSASIVLDDGSDPMPLYNQLEWSDTKLHDTYIVDLLYDDKVFNYCDLMQYTPSGVAGLLALHQVPSNASFVAFMNGQ